MSRKPAVLITGANGEIGQSLIVALTKRDPDVRVLALDLKEMDPEIRPRCEAGIVGDILDQGLLDRLVSEYEISTIYHLAALLSTRGEFTPETAHQVNVQGTLNLLKLGVEQSRWHGATVRFFFPSSIAVYGIPIRDTRNTIDPVREHNWTIPITMYGCNKLYCENLGRYYTRHYKQLAAEDHGRRIDFRSIRFPGLISAYTVPSGGTSDYGPEMIHAAAKGEPYACFVSEETRLPFMAMPDAVTAMVQLMQAPAESLSRVVYNINAFNPSAGEFAERTREVFPDAQISFEPDLQRERLVHSWPASVNDTLARSEWGFSPTYDIRRTFDEYLVPNIKKRYS
ncbi:MAG: NAD-dependent epimerase/dehydratase family protein [Planctomycetota bacterium]|nr:NAD-dependent epimerase/dehydratase family protein [Planctomycetota bacterium]